MSQVSMESLTLNTHHKLNSKKKKKNTKKTYLKELFRRVRLYVKVTLPYSKSCVMN